MKIRDIIQMLEEDGWYLAMTRGSHQQYKHSTNAGKHGNDLATGTLNSIFKQAGLKK
jgi:predicted RNA binding protein YcfA (HicA-like mRNA interferase family)